MFRNKQFILYAVALAAIFLLLRWMDYRLLLIDHAFEIYMGVLAVIFTLLGIWIALKLARPKTVVVEKQVFVSAPVETNGERSTQSFSRPVVPVANTVEKQNAAHPPKADIEELAERNTDQEDAVINTRKVEALNLSKRELEVLELMSRGLSNQEISDQLFVSLNTVKTHTSKLFEKMEVRRRTQAVDLGRRLGMIR